MRRRTMPLFAALALVLVACVPLPPSLPDGSPNAPVTGWPANMASHGVLFTASGVAATPAATTTPVPSVPAAGVTQIVAYIDPMCSHCADFLTMNADYLMLLADEGLATVELHPIGLLDSQNDGASTLGVAAIAAVVDAHPELALAFIEEIFVHQPEAPEPPYETSALAQHAVNIGASDGTVAAIEAEAFLPFAEAATTWALSQPAAGTTDSRLTATPSVFVNGERYLGDPADNAAFTEFVEST